MNPSRGLDAFAFPIYGPIFLIKLYGQPLWKALFSSCDASQSIQYEVHYLLGMMSDNGHPLWLALAIFALFPIAAAIEIIWAIFSGRVRTYIVKHPMAHFLWFASALFITFAILIPYPSTPRHPVEGGGSNNVVPNHRSALDARTALCLRIEAQWPGASESER
jgi:hypothetical protein